VPRRRVRRPQVRRRNRVGPHHDEHHDEDHDEGDLPFFARVRFIVIFIAAFIVAVSALKR
jgi:hypothetical protein